MGGNHISSMVADYKISIIDKKSKLPNEIKDLENDHFDLGMTGEGEFSFAELVNALLNNQDISKVPGLVKKIGSKKYLINPSTRIHDLNKFRFENFQFCNVILLTIPILINFDS